MDNIQWVSLDDTEEEKGDKLASEYENMVKFLDSAWCVRDEIVPCLVGPVGIGKTAAVEEHCRNVGAKRVVKIVASQILPNEVSGITMPDPETKAMEIFDHYRLSSMEDGDILFFDELLEADQIVLSACLTLIENRELMSGRKLPDIQIIAATNPTIKPTSLKANIRQRFLFRSFDLDRSGCGRYIEKKYGIKLGNLVNALEADSSDYNIMSQRSLTKMVHWICEVPEDEIDAVADEIDSAWKNGIGTKLAALRRNRDHNVDAAVKETVKNIVGDMADRRGMTFGSYLNEYTVEVRQDEKAEIESFDNVSMEDMMNILIQLPDWKEIEEMLKTIEAPRQDDNDVADIKF